MLTPLFRYAALAAFSLALALPAAAQERANDEPRPSPNATVGQTVGTTVLHVDYGRPSARDREIFGDEDALVPNGVVWRTGANEATAITLSSDVLVEGDTLRAGTYSLFTLPTDGDWTIIFNRVAEQWGAFRYDADEDVLRVTVTPDRDAPMQEQFEIRFEDVTATSATMSLLWDETSVPIRFQMLETSPSGG